MPAAALRNGGTYRRVKDMRHTSPRTPESPALESPALAGSVQLRRLSAVPPAEQEAVRQRWSLEVRRGGLLRLAPGVYVPPEQWLRAAPWDRHVIALAARASSAGGSLFCRESALALWGVPLFRVPSELSLRASSRGKVGRRPLRPLTGAASTETVSLLLAAHQRHDGVRMRPSAPRDLRGFPVRRVAPVRADGAGHPSEVQVAPTRLDLRHFPWLRGGPPGVDVEPLAFAVLDTVAESSLPAATVILDAVLAGRTGRKDQLSVPDLAGWSELLRTRRRRQRWSETLEFADADAESPGESAARALIHELGFEVPQLQRRYTLPNGRGARVDFAWDRVVAEFDGMVKYQGARELSGMSPEAAVAAEKEREDGLRALGLIVVRIVWADLLRPERLYQKLLRAGVPRQA
ncbi:hypothetical protein GCM10010467_24820 [Actinocorallia glomerata]|uniref:Transcriptional regulator, AbiEi antitoxin, Type IV TA system n=3 Tax=Actinomycetota TaxID=201174 RepID=A0ABP6LTN0_9MICC